MSAIRNNNRVILDISKCTHAWNGWITTCGNYKRRLKPIRPTVHGQEFDEQAKPMPDIAETLFPSDFKVPSTMLERAIQKGILDTWIPYTTFQLSNNHSITYTGDKAIAMMKAWGERIFNKKGKK